MRFGRHMLSIMTTPIVLTWEGFKTLTTRHWKWFLLLQQEMEILLWGIGVLRRCGIDWSRKILWLSLGLGQRSLPPPWLNWIISLMAVSSVTMMICYIDLIMNHHFTTWKSHDALFFKSVFNPDYWKYYWIQIYKSLSIFPRLIAIPQNSFLFDSIL